MTRPPSTVRSARTSRVRQGALLIAPATTPDIVSPAPLKHSDIAAALASASPRQLSCASRTRSLGEDAADECEEELDVGDEGEVNVGMQRWGWGMLGGSTLCFVTGVWSIAVGPFIDTESVFMLDAMAKDTHYKYLVIFIVPVTLYAVIINWWGLKIFRHA